MTQKPTGSHRAAALCAGIGVCASALAWGCVTNAATGRSQLNMLSREQEIQLGTESAGALTESYGGAVDDPALTAYVRMVGMRLVEHVEGDYGELPWEFTLLDSDVINAFALPGGKVFVSRGLVERFDNEAQLAAVLGHEVGHVTAEHADRAVSRQLILAGIAAGASMAAGNDETMQVAAGALVTGTGVFALTYDRKQETEADKLGMRYMTAAGYDPVGMLQVMEVLRDASGGGGQAEFLSTHPLPQSRIERIRERLSNGHYQQITGNPEYRLYPGRFKREFLNRVQRLHAAGQGG